MRRAPDVDVSYDVVMANHVLQRIPDDRAAMPEPFRQLEPGGIALLTVPLNAPCQQNRKHVAPSMPAEQRVRSSAPDQVRLHKTPIAGRIGCVGFEAETVSLTPEAEVRQSLPRMERFQAGHEPSV